MTTTLANIALINELAALQFGELTPACRADFADASAEARIAEAGPDLIRWCRSNINGDTQEAAVVVDGGHIEICAIDHLGTPHSMAITLAPL